MAERGPPPFLFGFPFSLHSTLRALPILSVTVLGFTLFVSFAMCFNNGHLPREFPSPSDTGVFQPESAYFSIGFSWAMIALGIGICKHSLFLRELIVNSRRGGWLDEERALRIATTFGVLATLCGTVVACFQVRQHVVIHTIGAAGLFLFFNVYYSIMLWLCSDKLHRWMLCFRTMMVVGCWGCLLGIIFFRSVFVYRGAYKNPDKETTLFLIMWANLFEWIWVALALVLVYYTFYYDEKHVYEKVQSMKISVRAKYYEVDV